MKVSLFYPEPKFDLNFLLSKIFITIFPKFSISYWLSYKIILYVYHKIVSDLVIVSRYSLNQISEFPLSYWIGLTQSCMVLYKDWLVNDTVTWPYVQYNVMVTWIRSLANSACSRLYVTLALSNLFNIEDIGYINKQSPYYYILW